MCDPPKTDSESSGARAGQEASVQVKKGVLDAATRSLFLHPALAVLVGPLGTSNRQVDLSRMTSTWTTDGLGLMLVEVYERKVPLR